MIARVIGFGLFLAAPLGLIFYVWLTLAPLLAK